MKNEILIFCLLCTVVFAGCKDDDDNGQQVVPAPNYHPLALGNYWVYDWVSIDTLGVEKKLNQKDSIFVAGDTIINGQSFKILDGVAYLSTLPLYVRDSSGYLYDHNGILQFAPPALSSNILRTDTFPDFAVIDYGTEKDLKRVSVPSGDFDCANFQGLMTPLLPDYPYGMRELNYCYADGVGLVLSNIFLFSSPDCLERRLVRYLIK